tara:strand:- start:57 stop:233 length:177 start_codon:yes stop_codon:yes gene_type:complete
MEKALTYLGSFLIIAFLLFALGVLINLVLTVLSQLLVVAAAVWLGYKLYNLQKENKSL